MLHGTPNSLINFILYCHHFSIITVSYFASFVTFPFVRYKINIIDIAHLKLDVLNRAVSAMNKVEFSQTDTKEARKSFSVRLRFFYHLCKHFGALMWRSI